MDIVCMKNVVCVENKCNVFNVEKDIPDFQLLGNINVQPIVSIITKNKMITLKIVRR